MKKSLFGMLAAAAALPASAAVVNYSWSGTGGYSAFGQFTTTVNSGAVTEAEISGATLTIMQGVTTIFDGSASPGTVTVGDIAFNLGSLGSGLTAASSLSLLGDDSDNGFFWSLSGTSGSNDWDLSDLFASSVATGPDNNLTLTAVPEPEMMAAVAGVGLVAFGLARRKLA